MKEVVPEMIADLRQLEWQKEFWKFMPGAREDREKEGYVVMI